uniref:Protodermal factor 1 n=1 Tax=Noccaea caerulescens TaxID=107243 RepID=A0A1J3E3I5_NOCCA
MGGMKSLTIWALFAALFSQQLFASVASISFEDQKTYYSPPDPSTGTPPSHGGSYTPTPSTPSHTPPSSNCGSPPYDPSPSPPSHTPTPSHHTPTPSHHTPTPKTPSHSTPPCNCGTPPHDPPTPSHPSTPSRPSTPSHPTPSNPPSGGYYSSPPPSTPVVVTPPTPIVDPGTPIIGGSPPTPIYIDPGTPGTPFVPAPFPPITGTCDYWRNHPTLIWGLLGWWGTVGGAFGTVSSPSSIPGFDPHMNLLQALSNSRTDAIGALYREGTASWLNSMVNNRFPFTTPQVRDHFVAGLSSTKAATKQAHTFKLANEGRLKPRV